MSMNQANHFTPAYSIGVAISEPEELDFKLLTFFHNFFHLFLAAFVEIELHLSKSEQFHKVKNN